MSTSARIGKLLPTGQILSTRIHWDGDRALSILQRQYNSESMVDALLAMGDMSALDETIETSEFYWRDRGETYHQNHALTFADHRDWLSGNHSEQYMYLFDPRSEEPTNRWVRRKD